MFKLKSLNVNANWSWRAWIGARLVSLVRVYMTLLLGWAIAHALLGDPWWLFPVNSLAIYLFLPVPLVLVAALVARRLETWIAFGVALALFAGMFGALFIPRSSPAQAGGSTLTVMTYNLLGYNENSAGIVAALRQSGADLIALQELNPLVADAIQRDLAREYPYQVLDPQPDVIGTGVISRYPLMPTGETLPLLFWVGQPQVLTMDYNGVPVTVLHAHLLPPGLGRPDTMEAGIHMRQEQARVIADFVAAHPGPLLAPMDMNANDQGTTYAIMTGALVDSWREAGWGAGHTFPGGDTPKGSRPRVAGLLVPMWLARIDFVFHSHHWQATSTWIGPYDGQSDHRPVVARLRLVK